jgi:N-acetylglutamate synthase-like GNAT family acetyltransferase
LVDWYFPNAQLLESRERRFYFRRELALPSGIPLNLHGRPGVPRPWRNRQDDDNNSMDQSTVQIREAEARDGPAIHELYRQLVQPVALDIEVNVNPDRIEQIRSDPYNFLWVLETENGVVGTAFVTLCLDPMHNRQPYAVLENFVIDERCRTKGYGALLMRYAVDFCYRADCSKIMLQSHSSRLQAHAFFETKGFSTANKKAFVKYRRDMK